MEQHEIVTVYDECKHIAEQYGLQITTQNSFSIEQNNITLLRAKTIKGIYIFLTGYKLGAKRSENNTAKNCTTCAMKNPYFPWCHYYHRIIQYPEQECQCGWVPKKGETNDQVNYETIRDK